MSIRTHYDVVVVGAGPAGSLTAARLAAGGLETLIVEKAQIHRPRVGEFLSPRAKAAIDRSGVLEPGWEMDHSVAWEFVSAWGSSKTARRNYLCDPYGHALVLDRARFDSALAAAARRAGATLLTNTRVLSAIRSGKFWQLRLNEAGSEAQLSSSFLVLCSGRLGGRLRGLETQRLRIDRLVCVGLRLANYRGDRRPLIEAYEHGWAYSVALRSGHLMVNMCTDADRSSHRRLSQSFDYLLDEIAACPLTCARLLEANPADSAGVEMFVTDASSTYTRPAAGPGWCLAGDCAQSMDPLSSSGIAQAVTHAELISSEIARATSIDDLELVLFSSHLDTSYHSYLTSRTQAYGSERRWPTPFWRRRIEIAENVSNADAQWASTPSEPRLTKVLKY